MPDVMTEIIDTLKELKRMHQLNYELLEQLSVTCTFLMENANVLPNREKFAALLTKAMVLNKEIQDRGELKEKGFSK